MNPDDFLRKGVARVLPRCPLASVTTIRIGGPCGWLLECPRPDSLIAAVRRLREMDRPYCVIGGGSNVVAADRGVDAVVIRYLTPRPEITKTDEGLKSSGATLLDALVETSVKMGLEGLVDMSGIPGTVGGGLAGNAGAFGRQLADVLTEAVLIDAGGRLRTVPAEELGFRYRHSRLKETGEIVVEARFRLRPGDPTDLERRRREILSLRAARHPDPRFLPNAGSFFRNLEGPTPTARRRAAGWFLEQAGAKALSVGDAAVYGGHANIIVNRGRAAAADVQRLAAAMAARVHDRFGLTLTREVRFLGDVLPGEDVHGAGFW